MTDCVREITTKKSCRYGEYKSFEYLLISLYITLYLIHKHTHSNARVHACTHVCIHTHTHTHTHTLTHSLTLALSLSLFPSLSLSLSHSLIEIIEEIARDNRCCCFHTTFPAILVSLTSALSLADMDLHASTRLFVAFAFVWQCLCLTPSCDGSR